MVVNGKVKNVKHQSCLNCKKVTLINVYFNNEIKIEIWTYKGQDSRIKKKKYYSGEEGFQNPTVDPQKSDKWHFNFALQ